MITKELNEQIHTEALRTCGSGVKGASFEIGAQWMYNQFPRLNDLSCQAYNTAVLRGQTDRNASHNNTFFGIFEELREFRAASEVDKSSHLPAYTQAQEELADVLICCLTELYRRETNVEALVKAKIEFNKTRI